MCSHGQHWSRMQTLSLQQGAVLSQILLSSSQEEPSDFSHYLSCEVTHKLWLPIDDKTLVLEYQAPQMGVKRTFSNFLHSSANKGQMFSCLACARRPLNPSGSPGSHLNRAVTSGWTLAYEFDPFHSYKKIASSSNVLQTRRQESLHLKRSVLSPIPLDRLGNKGQDDGAPKVLVTAQGEQTLG